jgi:hypothetical protein
MENGRSFTPADYLDWSRLAFQILAPFSCSSTPAKKF